SYSNLQPAPGRISDSAISIGLPSGTDSRTLPAPPSSDKTTIVPDVQATQFQKLIDLQNERIKLLGVEQQSIGLTAGQAAQLKTQIELETQARQQNIPLTDARKQAIADEAAKTAAATQALDDYKRQWAGVNSAVQFAGDQVIDVMDGLRQGTLST